VDSFLFILNFPVLNSLHDSFTKAKATLPSAEVLSVGPSFCKVETYSLFHLETKPLFQISTLLDSFSLYLHRFWFLTVLLAVKYTVFAATVTAFFCILA